MGPMATNIMFTCALGISAITQMIVPEDLRRQAADKTENAPDVCENVEDEIDENVPGSYEAVSQ